MINGRLQGGFEQNNSFLQQMAGYEMVRSTINCVLDLMTCGETTNAAALFLDDAKRAYDTVRPDFVFSCLLKLKARE